LLERTKTHSKSRSTKAKYALTNVLIVITKEHVTDTPRKNQQNKIVEMRGNPVIMQEKHKTGYCNSQLIPVKHGRSP